MNAGPSLASAYAQLDIRAERQATALKEIREHCDDAADQGAHAVYINVIDEILKRHGIN